LPIRAILFLSRTDHSLKQKFLNVVSGRGDRQGNGSVDIPPRPPETKEMIQSKLIPCERCGTVVAMLSFAPKATDPGHFEDYARKMYPHYNHLKRADLDPWPCIRRRATYSPSSRRAESVAGAGADSTGDPYLEGHSAIPQPPKLIA